MSRGIQTLLESATPTLVLAILVLAAGMGYGFYERAQTPADSANPALTQEAQSAN